MHCHMHISDLPKENKYITYTGKNVDTPFHLRKKHILKIIFAFSRLTKDKIKQKLYQLTEEVQRKTTVITIYEYITKAKNTQKDLPWRQLCTVNGIFTLIYSFLCHKVITAGVTIHSIAITNKADVKVNEIANKTSGLSFLYEKSDSSDALNQAFRTIGDLNSSK